MKDTVSTYRLVFSGEILPHQRIDAVKKELGRILKLDEARTDKLFSGQSYTLKRAADGDTAQRVKRKFAQAGALLRIEKENVQAPPAPVPETPSPPPAGSVEESTILGDIVFLLLTLIILCGLIYTGGWLWNRSRHPAGPAATPAKRPAAPLAPTAKSLKPGNPPRTTMKQKDDTAFWLEMQNLKKQALSLTRQQSYAKAEPLYRKRLEGMTQRFGENHRRLPGVMIDLAYVLRELERHGEAEALYLKAIRLADAADDGQGIPVAVACEGLAKIYLRTNRIADIDPLLQRAIHNWDRLRGSGNPNSLSLHRQRIQLLEKLGRHEEADVLRHYVQSVQSNKRPSTSQ